MPRPVYILLMVYCTTCCVSILVDGRSIDKDAANSQQRSLDDLVPAIDEFIQNFMSFKQMPGLSLAVVNGDTEQLTKGYGVKRLGSQDPVTEDTLFYIASTTKAITATVLLQTMLQNNISLDTPVKELFPEFQVAEFYRQQQATVGDLLSHRMGIPESLYNWLLGAVTTSRLDIVKRALYFKTSLPFRNANYYSNLFYQAAGLVNERVAGGNLWESVVRDTLFNPLKMNDTSFYHQLTEDQLSRLVTPYEPDWRNDNVMREVPMSFFEYAGLGAPGGAVVSRARDLVKWLYALTHGGLSEDGTRVVDEQVIKNTMIPHNIFDMQQYDSQPVEQISQNYGYGWYTGFYKGYRMVNHAGYMFGYHSFATVYPELKIGIFTCINGQQNGQGGMGDIHNYITDLILNQAPPPTVSLESLAKWKSPEAVLVSAHHKYLESLIDQVRNKQPVRDEFLDQFIDVYGNFAYGNLTIFFDDVTGRLRADYGDLSADLFHIGGDWFVGRPSANVWFFPPLEVTFARRPEDNTVIQATVPILLEVDPPVFTRGLTMDDAPPPPTCGC